MKMRCLTGLVALIASSAAAADTITVCASGCDHERISDALEAASGDCVIELFPEVYLEESTITIDGKNVTIRGVADEEGRPLSFLNGSNALLILDWNHDESGYLRIENVEFRNGLGAGTCGGLQMRGGRAELVNCSFIDNTSLSTLAGGAVDAANCELSFTGCRFAGNNATDGRGGALCSSGNKSITLTNCQFESNHAGYGGGALALSGPFSVRNCTFRFNRVVLKGDGGAVEGESGYFEECEFTGNAAGIGSKGGAVTGSGHFVACIFEGNNAWGGGAFKGTGTFQQCSFDGNHATSWEGGAIYVSYSTLTLESCMFTSNSAGTYGGALYAKFSQETSLSNCEFRVNTASFGGGIFFDESNEPLVTASLFCGNTPQDIAGQWQDGGGNTFSDACESCPDSDGDGVCDKDDQCPGEPDVDTDGDGVLDCDDGCPTDPWKTGPGRCGCNEVDTDIAGDYDCDGDFDADDYAAMGVALGICPGDLNGDAKVDGADLNVLLGAWGVCP